MPNRVSAAARALESLPTLIAIANTLMPNGIINDISQPSCDQHQKKGIGML